jgi:hypothetical protein
MINLPCPNCNKDLMLFEEELKGYKVVNDPDDPEGAFCVWQDTEDSYGTAGTQRIACSEQCGFELKKDQESPIVLDRLETEEVLAVKPYLEKLKDLLDSPEWI